MVPPMWWLAGLVADGGGGVKGRWPNCNLVKVSVDEESASMKNLRPRPSVPLNPMPHNFSNLSPADFEELVLDLIGKELKVRFEAFASGPDGGIDGRHA